MKALIALLLMCSPALASDHDYAVAVAEALAKQQPVASATPPVADRPAAPGATKRPLVVADAPGADLSFDEALPIYEQHSALIEAYCRKSHPEAYGPNYYLRLPMQRKVSLWIRAGRPDVNAAPAIRWLHFTKPDNCLWCDKADEDLLALTDEDLQPEVVFAGDPRCAAYRIGTFPTDVFVRNGRMRKYPDYPGSVEAYRLRLEAARAWKPMTVQRFSAVEADNYTPRVGYEGPGDVRYHLQNHHNVANAMSMSLDDAERKHDAIHLAEGRSTPRRGGGFLSRLLNR